MTIVRNSVAAPIAEPATRKLHGLSSRNATAAAIQFRPQAKASSTTSSLAVVAASLVFLESGMLLETRASGGGERHFVPARYSEERLAWRVLQRCKFVAEPCAGRYSRPDSKDVRLLHGRSRCVSYPSISGGSCALPATSLAIGIPS